MKLRLRGGPRGVKITATRKIANALSKRLRHYCMRTGRCTLHNLNNTYVALLIDLSTTRNLLWKQIAKCSLIYEQEREMGALCAPSSPLRWTTGACSTTRRVLHTCHPKPVSRRLSQRGSQKRIYSYRKSYKLIIILFVSFRYPLISAISRWDNLSRLIWFW